jgi:glycosyltransferase involved in cell wall biosynthesis
VDYVMFSAGRILPSKGCHTFLNALHILNYPGKILIVGDLSQIPSYEQEIRLLANGLDVSFVPLIREKSILLNHIKQAKLFVYPSYIEAMSIMMLEGACMRTPMICADIEENKAVFSDNETLYFKPEDADELACKIEFALNNPDEMQQLVNNAYSKLSNEYSWNSVARMYSDLFERTMR